VESKRTRTRRQRCPTRIIPFGVFGSESVVAGLLAQVRWRNGVICPRCCSDRTVRNDSYRDFQRYLCKNCDRTFTDKTGTIFAHSKIALRRWLFAIYASPRFNTSLRQLQCEIEVTHKTMRLPLISLGRSKSTKCTSLQGRKAASATPGRARLVCPRARSSLIATASHPYSSSLIAAPANDM